MKIELTKWEREVLHNIFKSVPSGNLGQIEQDMRIMNELKLPEADMAKTMLKNLYSEKEVEQLQGLLSKINADVWNVFPMNSMVPDPESSEQIAEVELDKKDVQRLCHVAMQGEGYPRHQRTLNLKKKIDQLREQINQ